LDLSVIILSWNTRELLRQCLESLRGGTGDLAAEVILIDNASSDGSADMVARDFPEVRLFRNAVNTGYAAGVNQGLRESRGERICLLGSDTRVLPDALPALAAFLDAHPEAGAVAPRLLNPDGSVQKGCMRFPTLTTVFWWDTPLQALWPESRELRRYQMRDWDHRGTRRVEQPPGTCLMLRRSMVERIGPMDERLWLFFNDVDWALRMHRARAPIWYVDEARIYHHLGRSTAQFPDFAPLWYQNRIAYYRKHYHVVGAALTKIHLVYAALRECWRTWCHVPFNRESRAYVRMVFGRMFELLARS
jgi:N-acetylglucosaminyl-diphospho-decaprenol L-rhamnosyltransferase